MTKSWFIETEVFMLHEIVALLDGLARKRVLGPRGLSYSEFLIAMTAGELDAPTQSDVGAMLDMSKSLISQRVAGLVEKDILSQRRDPTNRRRVRLSLTENGTRIMGEIYAELAANAGQLFDILGSDRPEFRKSLVRLIGALAVQAEREGAHAGAHPFLKTSEQGSGRK